MNKILRYCMAAMFAILVVCGCLAGCKPGSGIEQNPGKTAIAKVPEYKALSVKIEPHLVFAGQEVNIEAEIRNTSDTGGALPVPLMVNGDEIQNKQLNLNPGESGKITFVYKPDSAGKQSIGVAGTSADLTVLAGRFYKSKTLGFSINYPGGPYIEGKTSVTLTGKDGLVTKLIAAPVGRDIDKLKFAALAEDEIKRLPGYSIISQKEVPYSGADFAYRFEYSYLNSKVAYRCSLLSIKKGGYHFSAAAEILQVSWDASQAGIDASLASFKLPEVASGKCANTLSGFSFTLPEGWDALITGNSSQPVTILRPGGQGISIASLNISDTAESTSAQSFLMSQIGTIVNAMTGLILVSQREITVGGGARAHELIVSKSDNLVAHCACTILGNRAFFMVALAAPSDYSQIKQAFSQMVGTLSPAAPAPFGASIKDSLFLYYGEITSLDPAVSETGPADIIGAIFSGLVSQDRSFKAVPDIAEKWEISADGRTYTFHLREGVKFHNGRALTAADFKYSWERACDPKIDSGVVGIYLEDILGARDMLDGKSAELGGVKVVDDRTLQVTIDGPKPYFLNKLCQPAAFVIDKNNVAQGSDWTASPNGTGPFKLKEWVKDEKLILERNANYYGQPVKLQNIVFQIYAGNPQMMYEQGKIDATLVSSSNIDRALDPANPLSKESVNVVSFVGRFLGFNVSRPPFDDPNVRRAFALAINVDKIIRVTLSDNSVRAAGYIPGGVPGYNEDNAPLPYDVQQAKKFIEESKYGSAGALPPVVLSVLGSTSDVHQAMIAMWKQNLGVEVQVEITRELKEWQEISRDKDFQLFTTGWHADYMDPQNFMEVMFDSKSPQNIFNYSNPEVDAALKKSAVEPDADKRLKMYQDIEKMVLKDLPAAPLYMNSNTNMFIKPYVRGLLLYPVDINQWREISISR